MILKDIIDMDFETKDDLVVKLGEAIKEQEELQIKFDEVVSEKDKLKKEVNSLKSKNLELLSMIPSVVEDKVEETEDVSDIKIEDIFEEDKKNYMEV